MAAARTAEPEAAEPGAAQPALSPDRGLDRYGGMASLDAAADWTVPQAWERYGADEHAIWDLLFARQARQLKGRAASAFLRGLDVLHLSASFPIGSAR